MKKIIIALAGIMAVTMFTGCGSDGAVVVEKTNGTWMSMNTVLVEDVETEETLIERVETEHIEIENKYIDNEYQSELDYNSRKNGW